MIPDVAKEFEGNVRESGVRLNACNREAVGI